MIYNAYYSEQKCEIFYGTVSVHRRHIVAFLWKHRTLLCFDSYIYAKNNKNGMYFCVSVATMVRRTRHNITLYVHGLSFDHQDRV